MGERQQLPVYALAPMTTFGQMTPYGQFRLGPFELRGAARQAASGARRERLESKREEGEVACDRE